MLSLQSQTYTGKRPKEGFSGGFVEGNFVAVLTIEEGIDYEKGVGLLNGLKTELMNDQPDSLETFESTLSQLIVKLNFPAHFNLAAGLLHDEVLYVKTFGSGQVYFRRGKEFDLLMEGDKSASGELQPQDFALFTTSRVKEMIGEATDLKAFIGTENPKSITDRLHAKEYEEEEEGFVAVFIEFVTKESLTLMPSISPQSPVEPSVPSPPSITPAESESTATPSQSPIGNVIPPVVTPTVPTTLPPSLNESNPLDASENITETVPTEPLTDSLDAPSHTGLRSKLPAMDFLKSKKFNIVLVIILFGILLWSVVFGVQRRQAALINARVTETQTEIENKLTEAEEEAFLNMDGSLKLIEEAKADLDNLKQEVGDQKAEEIASMEQLIREAEGKITKKEEKEADEFYDLALEQENAAGIALNIDGDQVAMLDSVNKSVYVLSLDQKSLDEYTASEVSGATLVTIYNDTVYFFHPSKGVYRFTSSSKAENVIEGDKDWGKIVDMEMYIGNIYLLDSENEELYKYAVIQDGYSSKTSYFTGGAGDLSGATGLAIDSSVYISNSSDIYKYTSGAQEDFETEYPNDQPDYSGIFTSTDIEKVYGWDTSSGTVYVLAKTGTYDRQLAARIIQKAKGVFVYESDLFVFDGQKLYTISLE